MGLANSRVPDESRSFEPPVGNPVYQQAVRTDRLVQGDEEAKDSDAYIEVHMIMKIKPSEVSKLIGMPYNLIRTLASPHRPDANLSVVNPSEPDLEDVEHAERN
jgi:hypothetical protein